MFIKKKSVSTTEKEKCRVIPVMKEKGFVNKLYYIKRTNFSVYLFFANFASFGQFHKIKYAQKFI